MTWLAIRTFLGTVPQWIWLAALGVSLFGASILIANYHGKHSQEAINAEKTIERAVEANKPVTDPERASVMRKYSRDGHELH